MFPIALITLGITAALSLATPAKRAPALEVSLTAPTDVHSIDDIKVTAAVTNTGSEALKVIKYGTVLDSDLPTRSFKVSKDGVAADFTGIKLQVDIDSLDDSAFVVIHAGETVIVEHEVAPLYDFEALGTGAFEFEPVTTFQVVEADAKPHAHKVSAKKLTVNVKHDVARRELKAAAHEKRARVSCSSSSDASFISSAYSEGKSLASIAANYVSSHGADSLFRSYFGSTSTSTVRSVLSNVANENSSSRTLNCADPYGACTSGVIAYTVTSTTNVYFCSLFYSEVTTSRLCSGTSVASRNIRGGTVLHELTHATSGTVDVGYGCSYDQSLGQSNPREAAENADNYNCFATQIYQNTQC
ncbi:Metalloprotease [Cubamyces lactineus]|nr:Metalloprotease [Cubamyces lactineus]